MNRRRTNKGFTLIEVIVVLTILAMLAMMVVPSMRNLYMHSRQTARNNVARSIYMAAQSALTNRYSQGDAFKKSYISLIEHRVLELETIDGISNEEIADNANNIYFISTEQDGYDANNAVVTLIDPYMGDKSVLNDAILIEFNIQTGNVLSVFYSDDEEVAGFSYDGSTGYNVRNRSNAAALEAAYVGYFAVEYSGKALLPTPIGAVTVTLIDDIDFNSPTYGLLMAECTLPSAYSEKFSFELMLEPQTGSSSRVTFTNDSTDTQSIQLSAIKTHTTLAKAAAAPFSIGTRKIVVWYEQSVGIETLTFVLDGVQDGLAIGSNYPGVGCGFLSASFSATDGADTVTAFSNLKHAYYNGKVFGDANGAFEVASVRHLNNVRLTPSGYFKQTAKPLYLKNYDGTALNFAPLCTSVAPFLGEYNGDSGKIVGLTSTGRENGALFNYVGPGGAIKNVWLDGATTTIQAKELAGGIAAVNAGTISKCSVFGTEIKNTAAGNGTTTGAAGGVTAINAEGGVIYSCYTGVNVSAYNAAGGVAGVNSGIIMDCEVGTAAKNGALTSGCFPYYGARLGTANYIAATNYEIVNNSWTITVTESDGAAGGVAGRIPDTNGKVQTCVNADKIEGGVTNKFTGGIVGLVESSVSSGGISVQNSYNAGSVFGAGAAGGVVGKLSGKISGCYNTGTVNVETEQYPYGEDLAIYKTLVRFYATHNIDPAGVNQSGGVVGYGTSDSSVSYCYSAMYAGSRYGGAFGVMEGNFEYTYFRKSIYNNTNTYYNSTAASTDSSRTLRLTSETLRTLFAGYILPSGSLNGVGPFLYQLPYLENDDLKAGAFHRTPWKNVVESEGVVRLIDIGSGNIRMTVLCLRNESDLYIGDESDTDLNNYIHFHLNRGVLDTQLASSSATNPGSIRRENGNNKQFDIYRTEATNEEKALGYEYQYHILLGWNDLPTGTAIALSQLYGSRSQAHSDLLAEATLGRPYGMTFKTQAAWTTSRDIAYLEIDIDGFTDEARTLTFLYQENPNTSFTIDLTAGNMATSATSAQMAYVQYIFGDRDVHASFSGGNGRRGDAYIWKNANGHLCVMIFGGSTGRNTIRPNNPFHASVTIDGVTYSSTNSAEYIP